MIVQPMPRTITLQTGVLINVRLNIIKILDLYLIFCTYLRINFIFQLLQQLQYMNAVSSQERKLSSSLNLNPENKQSPPLNILSDQIFQQAQQIKQHLRNKNSTRTNSQNQNQLLLNTKNKKYDEIFEKKMESSQNTIHLEKSRLIDFSKIEVGISPKASKYPQNKLQEEKFLQDDSKDIFQKIPIHSLRSKRKQIHEQTNKIQNFYNYNLKKIENKKREEDKKAKEAQKLETIKRQKRKSLREITQAKLFHDQQHHKHSLQLKAHVYNHRLHKEYILEKTREQKREVGMTVRVNLQSLSEIMEELNASQIHQKQMNFMRQKISELKHRKQLEKLNQQKRKQRKGRLQKKWMDQLNSVQKCKQVMISKRQQLSYKIRQALNRYSRNMKEPWAS